MRKECTKQQFASDTEAMMAAIHVPVSPDGQQPVATYRCSACSRKEGHWVWHYTSRSQIKARNRGTRRARRH